MTKELQLLINLLSKSDKAELSSHLKQQTKKSIKSFKDLSPLGKALTITAGITALTLGAIATHKATNYITRNSSKQKELGILDARRH